MAHLTSLIATCESVWKATGGKEAQSQQGENELQDTFTKLRKEIAQDLKEIRKVLSCRHIFLTHAANYVTRQNAPRRSGCKDS